MPTKWKIRPDETAIWLGVLLDAAFDPTSKVLNLARSAEIHNAQVREQGLDLMRLTARDGRCELLSIAGDVTRYPEDYPTSRQAELLLAWAQRWLQQSDWTRLSARVRKRREKLNAVTP